MIKRVSVLVLALAACGGSAATPAQVQARWAKAVAAGDGASLWKLLDPALRQHVIAELDKLKAAAAPEPRTLFASSWNADPGNPVADAEVTTLFQRASDDLAQQLLLHSVMVCYGAGTAPIAPVTVSKGHVTGSLGGLFQDDVLAAGDLLLPSCTETVPAAAGGGDEFDLHLEMPPEGMLMRDIHGHHVDAARTIAGGVDVAPAARVAYARALAGVMDGWSQLGLERKASGGPTFHVARDGSVTVSLDLFDEASASRVARSQPKLTWKTVP